MTAEEAIRDYYEALRRGEPLYPYVAEDADAVKFAISDGYRGYDAIAEALREQTRTTADWSVDSRALTVAERDGYAWFADDVGLAWTDVEDDRRRSFDTRWSGTLESNAEGEWLFVSLHVSVARDL